MSPRRRVSFVPAEVRRLSLAEKLRHLEKLAPAYAYALDVIVTARIEEHYRELDERIKALGKPTQRTTGAQ
jgi:hypothetical protein